MINEIPIAEELTDILKYIDRPTILATIAYLPIIIASILETLYDSRAIIILILAFLAFIGSSTRKQYLIFAGIIAGSIEAAIGVVRLICFLVFKNPYMGTIGFYALVIGSSTALFSLILSEELSSGSLHRKSELFAIPKTEYAIQIIDVYKDYIVGPVVVHALRGINLKIKRGEFVSIMGPSGSGKSTLLNILGALDKPTKGTILIDGIDISKLSEDELAEFRNKKIGFIFQSYNLINRTKVLRNVEMPAIVTGMPKKERIKRAMHLLKIVGLDESTFNRRPIYLSGGQQQRVAIARALMNSPSIILADEPTGNLDSKTGKEVMNYLRMLNEKYGVTIVVVTHDRAVAEMTDRILHIKDGKIVKEEVINKKE